MSQIEIVKPILEFNFGTAPKKILGTATVGDEVSFPAGSHPQVIFTKDNGNSLGFKLTLPDKETSQFRFNESFFSPQELRELAQKFKFEIISHPYAAERITGSLEFKNSEYKVRCYGAVVGVYDKFFIIVYATRGNTTFEDNIVYVHGIWQVTLSDEFRRKLGNGRAA